LIKDTGVLQLLLNLSLSYNWNNNPHWKGRKEENSRNEEEVINGYHWKESCMMDTRKPLLELQNNSWKKTTHY
jgi:hypothetical protein